MKISGYKSFSPKFINIFVASYFVFFSLTAVAQLKDSDKSLIISNSCIVNNSSGVYYILDERKEPKGIGLSIGTHISYSQSLGKHFFISVSSGIFKQQFGIKRPFSYSDTSGPFNFLTKYYSYSNILIGGGIGYERDILRKIKLKSSVGYQWLHSFKQRYIVSKYPKQIERTHKSFSPGSFALLSTGIITPFKNDFSIGIDAVFPFIVKWQDDYVFFESNLSDDSQIIAKNIFSIGAIVSFYYNL